MLPIRKGMWVVHNNTVGILVNFNIQAGVGEVHYVDKAGDTFAVNPEARLEFIQQASAEDIPVSRRPSDEKLMQLGYMGERSQRSFETRIVAFQQAAPAAAAAPADAWYKRMGTSLRAIFSKGASK